MYLFVLILSYPIRSMSLAFLQIYLMFIYLDSRRPACTTYGLGSKNTQLNINMLVDKNDQDYCGVYTNEVGFIQIIF